MSNRGKKHDTWSDKVRARDKKCMACHSRYRLVAHHIKSWAEYPKERFHLTNGITLCDGCHTLLHHIYGASPTSEQLTIFLKAKKQ